MSTACLQLLLFELLKRQSDLVPAFLMTLGTFHLNRLVLSPLLLYHQSLSAPLLMPYVYLLCLVYSVTT